MLLGSVFVRTRIVAILLTATAATGGSLLPHAGAVAHVAAGPCATNDAAAATVQQVSRAEIRCAVDRFGPVPGGEKRAICIARRESGLVPTARSRPKGLYVGLYQHLRAAWKTRYDDYTDPTWGLPTSPFSGRTNAIVTIRMVQAIGGWKAAGWPVKAC